MYFLFSFSRTLWVLYVSTFVYPGPWSGLIYLSTQLVNMDLPNLVGWYNTSWIFYFLTASSLIALSVRLMWLQRTFIRAQRLHQKKLDLFADISNETRTDLTLVSGAIEQLLKMETDSEQMLNSLHVVCNNSRRFAGLVGELLDFPAIEGNRPALRVQQYDLVSFIEHVIFISTHPRQQKNIKLDLTTTHEQILLWYDHFLLEKAVYNLLLNAYKLSDYGAHISIALVLGNDMITLKVSRYHKELAPENLRQTFGNDFSATGRRDIDTGDGLGQPLSKKIIELHHGTLKESRSAGKEKPVPGCFIVSIPKGNKHFSPSELSREAVLAQRTIEAVENLTLGPDDYSEAGAAEVTVILAEENDELRRFTKQSLEEQHYQVFEYANVHQAWEMVIQTIPDIVISDVVIGSMDGFWLCEKLKNEPRTSHIPIILLPSISSEESKITGLKVRVDRYIGKPFLITALDLSIRNLLGLKKTIHEKLINTGSNSDFSGDLPDHLHASFLAKITSIIEYNMADPLFGVNQLSLAIGISRPVLYRKVKTVTGMSINDFSKNIRLKKAATLLRQGIYNVNEVSEMVGFSDRRYFSREFRKMFAVTPSEFARSAPDHTDS